MILADTSIWVDHLRDGDATMTAHLNAGLVLMHPFVVGELADLLPAGPSFIVRALGVDS